MTELATRFGEWAVKVSLEDVTGVASRAEPQMTLIMKELISGL